jgi:hypothetical protein
MGMAPGIGVVVREAAGTPADRVATRFAGIGAIWIGVPVSETRLTGRSGDCAESEFSEKARPMEAEMRAREFIEIGADADPGGQSFPSDGCDRRVAGPSCQDDWG